MELTNKRENYSVSNTDGTFNLQGELYFSGVNHLSLNGSITKADNSVLGNFSYSENGVTSNININSIPKGSLVAVHTLIETTVSEINTQLSI